MYQTNQAFLEAMDDISRTLTVQVEIGGEIYPTESIIDFELERGAFDGDVFTIGQTLSGALTLTIFTTSSVKIGDEVKLFTDLLVGDSYVRVPMGIYYVDSTSVNQEKMTLTCYDKMVSLVEEYIPSGDHKTLAALFNDVRTQIGMKYDGAFTDVAIKQALYGYTYRETLGFIASLNGGNMTINRSGNLEIQGYQEVERHIPAKTCFSFDVKEGYHVSKVFCLFGDVGISRGDNTGQCVSFENPYVTEQNIDVIYNRLKGLRFTAGSLKYRGDLTLDPGDLFTFTDYKGDEYVLMCGRNKLTFNGGLSGQLESIGESENSNVYAEHQLKYKKNMTKVTAELGKIQAIVQEIELSQDGLSERMQAAEQKITADAITSVVSDKFTTKSEFEDLSERLGVVSSDISSELSSLSEIVSSTNGSDALPPTMKVKLIAESKDAKSVYDNLFTMYQTVGNTSFSNLVTDMVNAHTSLQSAVNTLESTISETSETGLSNILTKFNNFYGAADHLNQAIINALKSITEELSTEIAQLADSVEIKINEFNSSLGELTTRFIFASDGLTIKSSANSTKYIKLDNDSLDFIDSGNMVAQISDNDLKISNATVNNQMKIGNISIKPSGKGGLMFVYE